MNLADLLAWLVIAAELYAVYGLVRFGVACVETVVMWPWERRR